MDPVKCWHASSHVPLWRQRQAQRDEITCSGSQNWDAGAQPRESIWKAICSSRSHCHPQSTTRAHAHTPQGWGSHPQRSPLESQFKSVFPSSGGSFVKSAAQGQVSLWHQIQPICAALSSVHSCGGGLWHAGGLRRLMKIKRLPFHAHLVYVRLVGDISDEHGERSRPVLGCEGIAAQGHRQLSKDTSPGSVSFHEFIPSGTVPLFHKILCIRSFPSGPVSSIFWLS